MNYAIAAIIFLFFLSTFSVNAEENQSHKYSINAKWSSGLGYSNLNWTSSGPGLLNSNLGQGQSLMESAEFEVDLGALEEVSEASNWLVNDDSSIELPEYSLSYELSLKAPWESASGKYPILPSRKAEEVYQDLAFMNKAELVNGDLSHTEENGKKILSENGKVFKKRFCDRVQYFARLGPNSFENLKYMPDLPSVAKRVSNVHLSSGMGSMVKQDALYRVSAASKDFFNKFCAGLSGQDCLEKHGNDEERYKAVCDEVFQTHFMYPRVDLKSNYLSSLSNGVKPELEARVDSSENPEAAGCDQGKSCYFMPNKGSASCNPFNCAMADKESLPTGELEWANAYLLASSEYKFESSEPTLCDKCFREQFKTLSGSEAGADSAFEKVKKNAEKALSDNLAANAAGKAILDFSAGLETIVDLGKLYPQTVGSSVASENLCGVDFSQMFRELADSGCSNGGPKAKDVRRRLALAAESLGLGGEALFQKGGLVKALVEGLDGPSRGNSCDREDFVKAAKLQWHSIDNREHAKAFKDVLNHSASNPEIAKRCDGQTPRNSADSVLDVYTESTAEIYWKEHGKKIVETASNGKGVANLLFSDICAVSEEGGVVENAVCGTGSETFRVIANEENLRLQKSFESDSRLANEKIEELFKNSLKLRLKTALEVPMKLDPVARLVLSDWDLYCEAKSQNENKHFSVMSALDSTSSNSLFNMAFQLNFNDYVESASVHKDLFKEKVKTFSNNICEKALVDVEASICREDASLAAEDGTGPYYSIEDIKKAQRQLREAKSPEEGLARNSLACSIRSRESRDPKSFSSIDKTLASAAGTPSRLEENLAALDRNLGIGKRPVVKWGLHFDNWQGCSDGTREAADRVLGARGDSEVETNKNRYNAARFMSYQQEMGSQYAAADSRKPVVAGNRKAFIKGGEGELYESSVAKNVAAEGSEILKNKFGSVDTRPGRTPASAPVDKDLSNNAVDSKRAKFSEDDFSNNSFETPGNQSWSPFPSAQAATEINSSFESSYRPNVEKSGLLDGREITKEEKVIAENAGIENLETSSSQFRQTFEDVLDRKLKRDDLDRLRADNERLMAEMKEIKNDLETEEKPLRVLDAAGEDRTSMVPNPPASTQVVLNPRNRAYSEFRSRAFYEGIKSEFSPSFSSTFQPERVSLREYSSQRRAIASETPINEVKDFNAKLDESFLQRTVSTIVDDNYVERYVEHVNRNSGSIEHLVVFENGMPARIRVPDPQNPGDYVERPLRGELAQTVLQEVEGDEISSYAIYNMVSFGESLQDFMVHLEREGSNLAALDLLNQRLEEAKSLE